ncbi:MAG: CHASE2 domain-containing protein, partial [Elusimicrobia bacterium]|nr:CHASE2 domain-containing protein [Elusimicrobiota bacterium]
MLRRGLPAPELRRRAGRAGAGVPRRGAHRPGALHRVHWPWPRSLYAAILDYCRAGGAKAVVFDILLSSPSPYGRDQDEAFAKALKGMNSVLALETRDGSARLPVPLLRRAAARLGDAAARPDPDGVFRRVPLSSEAGGVRYDSLAAAAVLAVSRSKAVSADGAVLRLGDYAVPLSDGRLLVRFRGPRAYPALPAGRVIRAWQNSLEGLPADPPPSAVKDRIVLVGLSAPGLMDLRPTPVAEVSPGTEVV